MAISTQIQNLNLIPGKSAPVVVHLSQGNVGNTVQFYLYDGDNPYYPTNVSIAVHGVRADNTVFGPYSVSVTSGSNLVSFTIVTAMTSVNGAAIGELVLTDSGQNQVGSANFGMLVEATPYSSSVTYEDDLSIYQRILAYVQSIPAELSGNITTEHNERVAAIGNEATLRAAADANLQTQINQIVAPTGEAPSTSEIQNARIGVDSVTYQSLGEAIRTQNTNLKRSIQNINGSWIKTNEVDYSQFVISENKHIKGYNTTTYLPLLETKNGSVVVDFAVNNIQQYDKIKFPRCTLSTQWIILYGSSSAYNYPKTSIASNSYVNLSDSSYGLIYCSALAATDYTRVAIAFDNDADITTDSQFKTFFELMDTVKYNKRTRAIHYHDTVDITVQATRGYVPFKIYAGERLRFTNYTTGDTALFAIDSNGSETTITDGIAARSSISFTSDRDYVTLRYWSQQLGTVTVDKLDAVVNDIQLTASVNMFRSIAAIGDSYTAASTLNTAGTWADYRELSWIATMGKRSGTEWKNYGHGGATAKSYLNTTEFQQSLSDTACDLYFFALGQNDGNQYLTVGSVTDINDSDYTQNPDTFYGNYGRIIQQIKNHAPNAKLVMITNWVQGSKWKSYDIAIRNIAAHYSIPVIEPFYDFYFNSELYLNYKNSGHPTAMGYSAMGIAMERLFSKCVIDNPGYFQYATIG